MRCIKWQKHKIKKNQWNKFFTYNNGIATTAADVETKEIDGQLYITKIVDLQIINGGQTTASLAEAVLKRSNVNLEEWNYIIVYKLDRFSRNKYESTIHKRTLKNNGVSVLSAMENIPDTPEGIILESLLEGMNAYYSAELAQKVKRGMRETRLKGYFQGGTLLYGYKLDGRKIVPDEYQAEVVRYIYDQFAKGVYVKDILKILNEKGVTHKGKPLPRNTVYNILKNDKYLGVYKHDDETVDNMYPQIVSYDTFEKVRNIVNANKHGKRSIDVVYMLRHKLKCGYCGQSIIAESGTSKTGAKMYYYKCRGRKARVNDCKKSVIQKSVLENLVLDHIISVLKEPCNMDFIVKTLMQMQNNSDKGNTALNMLLKQQKQTENTLNNLVAAKCVHYFKLCGVYSHTFC